MLIGTAAAGDEPFDGPANWGATGLMEIRLILSDNGIPLVAMTTTREDAGLFLTDKLTAAEFLRLIMHGHRFYWCDDFLRERLHCFPQKKAEVEQEMHEGGARGFSIYFSFLTYRHLIITI